MFGTVAKASPPFGAVTEPTAASVGVAAVPAVAGDASSAVATTAADVAKAAAARLILESTACIDVPPCPRPVRAQGDYGSGRGAKSERASFIRMRLVSECVWYWNARGEGGQPPS